MSALLEINDHQTDRDAVPPTVIAPVDSQSVEVNTAACNTGELNDTDAIDHGVQTGMTGQAISERESNNMARMAESSFQRFTTYDREMDRWDRLTKFRSRCRVAIHRPAIRSDVLEPVVLIITSYIFFLNENFH